MTRSHSRSSSPRVRVACRCRGRFRPHITCASLCSTVAATAITNGSTGAAVPWHGHAPQTAAAVAGVLARLHGLRMPWSAHLAPERPTRGVTRWLTLLESARSFDAELRATLDRALPSLSDLEALPS